MKVIYDNRRRSDSAIILVHIGQRDIAAVFEGRDQWWILLSLPPTTHRRPRKPISF